jgi:hypothetical protein
MIEPVVPTSSGAVRVMRLQYRRFLSYVLLAVFAGISLLGEGLHLLTTEAGRHHHHHGHFIVAHARHGLRHKDHNFGSGGHASTFADGAGRKSSSASAVLILGENDVDSHVCGICEYLSQAVSQPIEVAGPIDWQPLVTAVPNLLQRICTPTSLGPQAPRGPPFTA